MGFNTPERRSSVLTSPRRAAAAMLVSLSTLMTLCAKQAYRASKKIQTKLKSKRFLKNTKTKKKQKKKKKKNRGSDEMEEEWGDGGVWQKAILMGDKCEPLDFSGVIYYDSYGKQLDEVPPRSPRASPLPSFLTSTHPQVY
ncbi:hypothetical protein SDJN02_24858, partial [Cucurbita argyrosperma subsp. argyrosperma]